MPETLYVGWRSIARAADRNADTLRNALCSGRLPITPERFGTQIAMTASQVAIVKAATRPPRPRNETAEV